MHVQNIDRLNVEFHFPVSDEIEGFLEIEEERVLAWDTTPPKIGESPYYLTGRPQELDQMKN